MLPRYVTAWLNKTKFPICAEGIESVSVAESAETVALAPSDVTTNGKTVPFVVIPLGATEPDPTRDAGAEVTMAEEVIVLEAAVEAGVVDVAGASVEVVVGGV